MKAYKLEMVVLLLTLLISVVGCQSFEVHQFDQNTVQHLTDAKQQYIEDVARMAGLDDPQLLDPTHFPVGKLTWEEYEAKLAEHDAWIEYEKSKYVPPKEE